MYMEDQWIRDLIWCSFTMRSYSSLNLQKLLVLVVSGRDEADLVKASAGAVLARVFVQNNAFFAQFTSQPSLSLALQQSGVPVTDQSALFIFFDAWLDKVTEGHKVFFSLSSWFFYADVRVGINWQEFLAYSCVSFLFGAVHLHPSFHLGLLLVMYALNIHLC